jgi:hypothetical protein
MKHWAAVHNGVVVGSRRTMRDYRYAVIHIGGAAGPFATFQSLAGRRRCRRWVLPGDGADEGDRADGRDVDAVARRREPECRRGAAAMIRPGQCRWCRCTHEEPCPGSCGWADRAQTLCTACVDVDRAWSQVMTPAFNMRRAFFRGFLRGTDDERALDTAQSGNPYAPGRTAKFFDDGFLAGMAHTRRLARAR